MPFVLPSTVRLTAVPPFTGTFHTSKPSLSSTEVPSFDQPIGWLGGVTSVLWSSDVSEKTAGTPFVTFLFSPVVTSSIHQFASSPQYSTRLPFGSGSVG